MGLLILPALLAPAMLALGAAPAPTLPQMPPLDAHDRVLVVAPHPDDETLCCAGLLLQAQRAGASVAVVWVTAGDSFELDAMLVERNVWPDGAAMRRLGTQRLAEAHTAADALGVARAAQFLLGYPDRGLLALSRENYDRPYHSKYTDVSAVPYAGALSPGASYTGANLERDLTQVIAQFRPTLVLAAAPQDRHPDHSASGALVRRVLARRGELAGLRYWIVHARDWPRPLGLAPELPLLPPASAAALAWQSLALSEPQRARKLAAVRAYQSQMQLMSPYLKAFVRANEIFAAAP